MVRTIALLLVLFSSCWIQPKDIPPKRSDITKNIHVIFDKSLSMEPKDFAAGYAELEQIVAQNDDEFNLAITMFAGGTARMQVKDPNCSVGDNWMAMPDAIHYKKIMHWVKTTNVNPIGTYISDAVARAIKENVQGLTIIIITDCAVMDFTIAINMIKKYNEKNPENKIKLGVVNVDAYISSTIYDDLKKFGAWYICLEKDKEE